jgi:hypothetical protein
MRGNKILLQTYEWFYVHTSAIGAMFCICRSSLALPHTYRGFPAELLALSLLGCQCLTQALHDTGTPPRHASHAAAPHIIGWLGTSTVQPGPSKRVIFSPVSFCSSVVSILCGLLDEKSPNICVFTLASVHFTWFSQS